jgi:hypothetical protein
MDKGTVNHFNVLKRVITYAEQYKKTDVQINSQNLKKWKIEAFADKFFCGDRENRRSLTVLIVFYEVPVSWKSNLQNNVSLYTTENLSSGVRSCHIDTCYHFIGKHAEDGLINILLIKLATV